MTNKQKHLAKAKKIYKDKCPRCRKKLHYLTNCNDDFIIMCENYSCQFCMVVEGDHTYLGTG
jgi:hypothetical protein